MKMSECFSRYVKCNFELNTKQSSNLVACITTAVYTNQTKINDVSLITDYRATCQPTLCSNQR